MTRLPFALVLAVLAGCGGCEDPPQPTTTAPSAAASPAVAKRPAAAIEAEITRLQKQIEERRKQAPRVFDQQKAKKLNEEIAALEKRMHAAKLELEAAHENP